MWVVSYCNQIVSFILNSLASYQYPLPFKLPKLQLSYWSMVFNSKIWAKHTSVLNILLLMKDIKRWIDIAFMLFMIANSLYDVVSMFYKMFHTCWDDTWNILSQWFCNKKLISQYQQFCERTLEKIHCFLKINQLFLHWMIKSTWKYN